MVDGASCIYVFAGVNGAGKTTLGSAVYAPSREEHFNPDAFARELLESNPHLTTEKANSAAWQQMVAELRQAIANGETFVFETTLGGETITAVLEAALRRGMPVRMWYFGLESVELHIARVSARVAGGGHHIPEARIRERFRTSPRNLQRLLPLLTELRVFDNSEEADPASGLEPRPKPILHTRLGRIIECADNIPAWAQPIVAEAQGAQ